MSFVSERVGRDLAPECDSAYALRTATSSVSAFPDRPSSGTPMSPLWLKSLPWSTILSNAPLIVEGARKLAALVKSKPADEGLSHGADTFEGDPVLELAALRARVQRLEEELHQASGLVRTMAESQAQMAQMVEALRRRTRLSIRIAAISLVGLVTLLLWTLVR